jgi:lysophospholipase L1-like esterase
MSATTLTAPISRRKLWFFWLILIAIVVGVLQLGAYVYLRVARGYDGQHLMQYEFDPYKNILPTRNYVDTRGVRHNSVGFRRSTEVSRVKPPGTIRIFLMGGSTAYGLGSMWTHIQRDFAVIRNEDTIDAYLERRLSAEFPGTRIEVINAAITSTWTHHSLIYLYQTILDYDPDVVLFLDGFNDFFFTDRGHDQFASYTYNQTSFMVEGDPTFYNLAAMNGWWLFRKFALANVLGRAGRELKLIVSHPGANRKPMNPEREFAGLKEVFPRSAGATHERIGVLLRHEGVDAVFMLQPILILDRGRSQMTPVERSLFDFNAKEYLPNYEAFMHLATPWIVQWETGMAQRVGGTFLDLTGIFEGIPGQVFTDYCHLTPHGNEVLAGAIQPRIAALIRARRQRAAASSIPVRAPPAH